MLMGRVRRRTDRAWLLQRSVRDGSISKNWWWRRWQLHLTLTISIGCGSRVVLLRIRDLLALGLDRLLLLCDQVLQHLHLTFRVPQPLLELGDLSARLWCFWSLPHCLHELILGL